MGKYNKVVRIRQMLQRWRNTPPSDVPAGHVAISVGSEHMRFIVRATYLNHPVFTKLLAQAEEEYGFSNQGPLAIPCDESVFLDILRLVTRSTDSARVDDLQICYHGMSFWDDQSRPLLLS